MITDYGDHIDNDFKFLDGHYNSIIFICQYCNEKNTIHFYSYLDRIKKNKSYYNCRDNRKNNY